jgi:hypothetical protein
MNEEIFTDPQSRIRTIAGEPKPTDMFSETIHAVNEISVNFVELQKLSH